MFKNLFKNSNSPDNKSIGQINLGDFSSLMEDLKKECIKLLNDDDIKSQITEIKEEVERGIKELGEISFKNSAPDKLYFHEFDRPLTLKDVIDMSNKYKDPRANAIALHHFKNSNYQLLTIFFLGQDNEPFIDENKDVFINLQGTDISEDLKSLLEDKKLIILN